MKKLLVAGGILLSSTLLAGCVEEKTYIFEEEERSEYEVEDILGDRLESENPGVDIDVDIKEDHD